MSGRNIGTVVRDVASKLSPRRRTRNEDSAAEAEQFPRPQVIPGYDLRPSHCARVGHIGRSVYLPWGTIVCGQIGVI
eukprot:COSAG06_NODE_41801_length_387_cov_1.350694_1_plen_76_part_10